jgi:PHP family Zn ribbon phosphoesterase
MSPRAIVERALEVGVNCLALTDHNSAANCGAIAKLCEREGILFFPGLEVTTAEEAHVVCLFGEVGAAEEMGGIIYESLPPIKNIPEKTGDQVIVNEDDEIEGEVEKYLVVASAYTVDQLREIVKSLGGLFIAAHVDKPCFSIVSQLGVLSGEFSAAELSRAGVMRGNTEKLTAGYRAVTASDSHYIHSIGSACVEFESADASLGGYGRALRDGTAKTVIFDHAFRTPPGGRDG